MEFRLVLKDLRKSRNITQVQLAEALNVSRSIIGSYENGSRKPSYTALEDIADYFNVDIDYLMGHEPVSTYLIEPKSEHLLRIIEARKDLLELIEYAKGLPADDIQLLVAMAKKMLHE